MGDLPDFITGVDTGVMQAASLVNGADAAKATYPAVGDVYLATDTWKLYVCVAAGAWTGFDASILIKGILTLYADLAGDGFEIKNIKDPTAAQSAATRAYVLAQLGSYLALAGGTMAGNIAMATHKVTGLGAPTAAADAARKSEVDAEATARAADVDAEEAARIIDVDAVEAKLDDISQTQPTRAIGTQYQNSTKIRMVVVGALAVGGSRNLMVYIKSTSPANDEMGRQDIVENKEGMVTFVVPPGYYYKVDGTATKQEWHEWDLH